MRPAGRRRFIGAAGAPADQLHKLLCHVDKGRCLAIAGGGARISLADSDALVQFEIAQSRRVSVEIRDLQGKVLETEDFGTLQPGVHNHTVDVTSWAAGTYSYTLVIDGVRATRKLMVK